MEKFRRHSYEKAVELFQLCLLFHPDDSSGVKFRHSVQSDQATAYFHLNNYRKALEVGEKSYNSNPTFKSKVRYILASKAPLRSDFDWLIATIFQKGTKVSTDKKERSPHLPTAFLVLPFVISLNVIVHCFFFISSNSTAYPVCCLDYQLWALWADWTKLWSVYHL